MIRCEITSKGVNSKLLYNAIVDEINIIVYDLIFSISRVEDIDALAELIDSTVGDVSARTNNIERYSVKKTYKPFNNHYTGASASVAFIDIKYRQKNCLNDTYIRCDVIMETSDIIGLNLTDDLSFQID